MARTTLALPSRAYSVHARLSGGNGSVPTSEAERLGHVEALLEDVRKELTVQLRRMGDMQAEIDRLKSPTRNGPSLAPVSDSPSAWLLGRRRQQGR
jgi:hypothetical protein